VAETTKEQLDSFFVPNLCDVRMVFSVVVIGELLAFLLALAPFTAAHDRWNQLSIISLFVQWVGLTSAGLLCVLRPTLARLRENTAATISYLLLVAVTGTLSEAAYRIASTLSLGWEATPAWHVELVGRNVILSSIISAVVLRYFYVQHRWMQQTKAEAQARIEALQARIRPHFLFNSMNTIAALTRTDPELAEEAVENLADLFRHSFSDNVRLVPFADELDLSRRYLSIEALRLGDRLKVEWNVDAVPPDALIPPLTLQPLLENSIYHGIEPSIEGGSVKVRATLEGPLVKIEIENPIPTTRHAARAGNRMALKNIQLRIEGLYPEQGRVTAQAVGNTFHVEIVLPLQVSKA
jgi:two-component system sensor histidine kinase AlgZ